MGTRGAFPPSRQYKDAYSFEDNPIEWPRRDLKDFEQVDSSGPVAKYVFRFTSPESDEIYSDRGNFDNRANRSFLCRMYLVVGRQAQNAALIYNGLDETIHQFDGRETDLYGFYDELGMTLASRGVLSILLPTPYHMNRVLAYKDKEHERRSRAERGPGYVDWTVPANALMEHSYNIYRNHFQGFKETLALCAALAPHTAAGVFPGLLPRDPVVSPSVMDLFRDFVVPHASISLIGYSLGGLRAMTEFIRDRYEVMTERRRPLFASCVAVNSGGALHTLTHPPWVDPERWSVMINNLVRQRFGSVDDKRFLGISERDKPEAVRHFAHLDDVFLGQGIGLNVLGKTAARDILFVLGGADDLVPMDSLKRFAPGGGLNIHQISGMGHLFPYDEAWTQWKELVLDHIAQFVIRTERARKTTTDRMELLEFVSLLDHGLAIMPWDTRLPDLRRFEEAIASIQNAPPTTSVIDRVLGELPSHWSAARRKDAAKCEAAFRSYATDILRRFALLVGTRQCPPGMYNRVRRALLLGAFVFTDNPRLISGLSKLLGSSDKRLGEALVERGVIDEDMLTEALHHQKQVLDRIRRRMLSAFAEHLPASDDLEHGAAAG